MSFIGNAPAAIPTSFQAVQADSFNGNGSTTNFTLSRQITNLYDIEVLVDNVQQSPYDGSYSVNGTTITFSSAPGSGTNNIYIVYRDHPITSIAPKGQEIELFSSGGGTFTVTPASSATDRTFTLPDETGTIDTLQRAGNVLQVASTTLQGVITTTTQGAPSTITNGAQVFSLSFTPISASSTILVQTSTVAISEESNIADNTWLALWDDTTFIAANSATWIYTHFAGSLNGNYTSLNESFSAGSTSTRTIQVRAGMNGGTGTIYINGNSYSNYTGTSNQVRMIVWEIAG
jgi:hypothetical protein